jgi:hypothetical protein
MVLALGVPSAAQQPRQPDASGVQQPASPQALAPAIAKDAAPYAPRCSAPKDHDEADFCEQRDVEDFGSGHGLALSAQ